MRIEYNGSTDEGQLDISVEFGTRDGATGIWLTSTEDGQRVFVRLDKVNQLAGSLTSVHRVTAELDQMGLALSVVGLPSHSRDSGGKLSNGGSEMCNALQVVPLGEASGILSSSDGSVSSVGGVDVPHGSSPSVGSPDSVRGSCGDLNPTEGEANNQVVINEMTIADPLEIARAVEERQRRAKRLRDL